ncbi:uncharacterized protein LOC129770273 [Toxorhynchites rutilus septentrionalis]|uniref:uncharacterized protein LOC129770273 n=1 Tax=Toxorhynchites rutilus septentrionalis TaxID=329112 RepID=UPI00247A7C30|nr:uncharacterized protein LOC129770273 [Toxorhynchites rutilus septentrionalis]
MESNNKNKQSAVRKLKFIEIDARDSGEEKDTPDSVTDNTEKNSDQGKNQECASSEIDSAESMSPTADRPENYWDMFVGLKKKLCSTLIKSKPQGAPGSSNDTEPNIDEAEIDEVFQTLMNNEPTLLERNSPYASLVDQIKTQLHVKMQLKNALSAGMSSKKFLPFVQLVETQRLLLLSSLKEKAAKRELWRLLNNKKANITRKIDFVTLTNFQISLSERALNEPGIGNLYVVVCSYKNHVHTTYVEQQYESRVHIRNSKITFHDLDEEYGIKVEIFALKMSDLLPSFASEADFPRFESHGHVVFKPSGMKASTSSSQQDLTNSSSMKDISYSSYHPIRTGSQERVRCGSRKIYLVEYSRTLDFDRTKYELLDSIEMTIKTEI